MIGVIVLGIDLGFRYTGNEEQLNLIIAKINNALPFNSFKNTIITSMCRVPSKYGDLLIPGFGDTNFIG